VILVAGVGYSHLSDLSFGPLLVERLQELSWPDGVRIEDFSYGPIGVLMRLEDEPFRYSRAVFAGAMERDRVPGTLNIYSWEGGPADPEQVQARIAEAVTGVISLENLLIIMDHFGALPASTSVIELEPVEREWGMDMSPLGRQRIEEALDWIQADVSSLTEVSSNGSARTAGT
jgi:hydrogenase maturation protease